MGTKSDSMFVENWPTDDWFERLAQGEPDVVEEFWGTFGGPLRRVAQRQISSSLAQRVDADDIVQSACRTFFRRAGQGEFECADSQDLWRLMLTITLNKARMQARFHTRQRRGIQSQQPIDSAPAAASANYDEAIEAVDFADFLQAVFAKLDDESTNILQRLLDGKSQEEIAESVGCSQRTVRRMKTRIRENLESMLREQLQHG